MRPLANNIREARKNKGWSQERAAQKLGIKRPAYAKYEEDRAQPKADMLRIIMEHFGIQEQDMYPFVFNQEFWGEKNTC